ncbi:MAG: coenzyme F430 synthase [Candidatus Nezhaarchaeales archaeon]
MKGLSNCRVLVIDMTHGGPVLCRELLRRGCVVYCFDNHKTMREDSIREFKAIGVEVYRDEAEIPHIDLFDVIVVQHADPKLKLFSKALEHGVPIITHARAVGMILSDEKGSTKIIEVTGTNGKTTTCNMIAKAASDNGFNVLIHDSINTRFIGEESKVLAEGLSITPANVLRAWRLAEEHKLKPDICIFEVSLGGTGTADVGIVTGIYDNYRASFMVNAFNSKLQMAINMNCNSILVLNGDNKPSHRFMHVFKGVSNVYGLENGLQVKGRFRGYDVNSGMLIEGETCELNTLESKKVSCSFSFNLKPQLFGKYQALNALAALTALLSLGFKVDDVCKSISGFEGVKGRSKAIVESWGLIVDCNNRGVNIPAIISALREAVSLKSLGVVKRVIAVIGGSERATCELIDADKLARDLNKIDEVDLYILCGALGVKLRENGVKGMTFSSLNDAIDFAREEASKKPKSIVVVCCNEA